MNSPRKPSPSHVISKIPIIPSGIVKDELDSTTTNGKGLWLRRGHGIDDEMNSDNGDDDGMDVDAKLKKRKKDQCGKSKKKAIKLLEKIV